MPNKHVYTIVLLRSYASSELYHRICTLSGYSHHVAIGDIKRHLATNSANFGGTLGNLQCELSAEASPVSIAYRHKIERLANENELYIPFGHKM